MAKGGFTLAPTRNSYDTGRPHLYAKEVQEEKLVRAFAKPGMCSRGPNAFKSFLWIIFNRMGIPW